MDYLVDLARNVAKYFSEHAVTEEFREVEPVVPEGAQKIAAFLTERPHLQQKLADLVDYNPSRWLLEQEIPTVQARRKIHHRPDVDFDSKNNDCYEWARKATLQGICFSGGGIRSATLNLGILQGLAKLGVLERFDYLSSVSGGGYIHEWLAAWIKREEQECQSRDGLGKPPARYKAGDGFKSVESQLVPLPSDPTHPIHPDPIRWLRRYSNYLTPQKGLFTADTWVAVAIWLRNTFLNQLTLGSGLLFLLLVLDVAAGPMTKLPQPCSTIFAGVLFLVATGFMAHALRKEYKRIRFLDENPDAKQVENPGTLWNENKILLYVIVPFLLAGVLQMSLAIGPQNGGASVSCWAEIGSVFAALWVMIVLVALAGSAEKAYEMFHGLREKPAGTWAKIFRALRIAVNGVGVLVLMNAALSALAGTGFYLAVRWALHCHPPDWLMSALGWPEPWRFQATFGPPLLLAVPFFALVIGAGLVGRDFPDWLREWLARVRAWSLLVGVGWAVLFGIALLGPYVIEWHSSYEKTLKGVKWTTVIGWIATTAGSVFAGSSGKTNGEAKDKGSRNFSLELLAKIGPYIFVLGLLLALSLAANRALQFADPSDREWMDLCVVGVPLGIFLLFGWRVDVNDFSMNSFYRNRLTRCYLGASNRTRTPNPLTGFDDRDARGMQISRLCATAKPMPGDKVTFTGPIPIICTAINLSFGEDLAWQERKAASFAFTPLYSGYHVGWTAGKAGSRLSYNGYVPSSHYAVPDGGINVATAVSISGAAASPNWGYHTNPATAFLMTMFNVRLGWWLFNPRRAASAGAALSAPPGPPEWSSPRFAPLELTKELFGMADDTSKYVYLSDGGHFDNMGLYELVRRRCYRIVICDMEQDEAYHFEGIANAIRKCRIDFGAEITLDLTNLRPVAPAGNSVAHWALGSIRYPETPEDRQVQDTHEGKILYVKSSLTGATKYQDTDLPNEPADIVNYKFTHEHFPHDTTANQWFTESQFESYRRLGYHAIDEIQKSGQWLHF
jgi:hypothetical protein